MGGGIMNFFKKVLVLITFCFISISFFSRDAFAIVQYDSSTIEGTARNAFFETLGTGLTGALNTFTIKVVNNSGSNVAINAGAFPIYEFNDSSYQGAYPPTSYKWSPSSIACNPSDRCTGFPITAITSGAGVVTVTGTFTSKTFNASKYYIGGYFASNNGNVLKAVGSSTDLFAGSVWYDNSSSYARVDLFGAHGTYYANLLSTVSDLYFQVNGEVPDPGVSFTGDETVDILNHSITKSFSGDFYTVDDDYYADILVWRECTRTGYASDNSQSPIVHIRAEANDCNTSSVMDSPGYYTASDYCVDPVNTAWSVDNVALEYPADYACIYPVTYTLYQRHCTFVSEWSGYHCASPTVVSEGDLGTFTPEADTSGADSNVDEPAKTDPLAWVAWKIEQILRSLFGLDNVDMDRLVFVKDEAIKRVPFAYVNEIFTLDWSAPESSGSVVPSMVFAFATPETITDYTYNSDSVVSGVLALIRPLFTVVIWLIFLVYLVHRVRELVVRL